MSYYTEKPDVSKSYREGYLGCVESYIKSLEEAAADERRSFITPEKLAADPEGYRKKFYAMLGKPLTEYEKYRNIPVECVEDTYVGSDDECEIRRMRLRVMDGFTMYGILFTPHNAEPDAPFVISQHGGAGTPEVCSDFYGPNNYNQMTRRLISRGAIVFAPQLLLWNVDSFCTPYSRAETDTKLKMLGSSITALEVFGIMRCIDYFVDQPYCNKDRIGMVGLSYGGFYTMMTTAADTRIKSAYDSCAFIDMIKHNSWADWTWSDSGNTFLEAEIAALVAPRYICFDAGDVDEIFGSESTVSEFERLKPFFEAQNAGDHIYLKTFYGPHEMDKADDCMDFFFSHL